MYPKHGATLHTRLINLACQNGWQQHGWKAAIQATLHEERWVGEADEVLEVIREIRFIPDAWRIRIEKQGEGPSWSYAVLVLELLEVEVTNPIEPQKLLCYEDLWWAMDSSALFHLRVFRMDRYGFVLPLLTEYTAPRFLQGNYPEGKERYIEVPIKDVSNVE